MAAGVAAAVVAPSHFDGGYSQAVAAPLGLALILAAAALWSTGFRPVSRVAAAALAALALGILAVASVGWGGLPDPAWLMLERCATAAAALVVAAQLAAAGRAAAVLAGLLAGSVLAAADILARLALSPSPERWFRGRVLDGLVGYHNAEATVVLFALPLVLVAAEGRPIRRGVAATAGTIALSVALLTQSRGGLLAAVAACVVVLALRRNRRTGLAAVALAGATALLWPRLRAVDAALLDGSSPAHALRVYVTWTIAVSLAAGVAVALPWRRGAARAALALAVLALAGAVALEAPALGRAAREVAHGLVSDAPPNASPGATRLFELSLNGRLDAWRVAVHAVASAPLVGHGQGSFAVAWTRERSLDQLYILQPHSLELELGSELGLVGLGLFFAFVGAVALALRHGANRRHVAAAAGVVVLALVQASVDWTWSFAAIVACTCLAAGAAAGGRRAPSRAGDVVLAAGVAAAALAVFGVGWVSVVTASAARGSSSEAQRWRLAERALSLDPWSESALVQSGRAAEAVGDYRLAAVRYARAATVSQRPWLDRFREARVDAAAGDDAARAAACAAATAANPGEPLLRAGPCAPRPATG